MAHFSGQSLMPETQYRGKINLQRNSMVNVQTLTDLLRLKPGFNVFSSLSESEYSESVEEPVFIKKPSRNLREKTAMKKLTRCEKLRSSQKLIDTLIIVLSIAGLLSETYNYEYNFTGSMSVKYKSEEMNNMIRVTSSVLTGLCIILAFLRSFVAHQLKREKKIIFEQRTKNYFLSSPFITLVIDFSILIVHAPPFIDFEIEFKQLGGSLYLNFGSICLSYMLLRFLFLFRIFLYYSKWSTPHVQKICKEHEVGHPLKFALKSCLTDKPHFLLIPIFAISSFAFGVALQVFEQPYNEDNSVFADAPYAASPVNQDYYFLYNSMWLIVITMTTVGYGDFFARTHMGRIVSVIAIIWGTFLFSLLILMVNDFVRFTRPQENSFNFLSKLSLNQEIRKHAANIIGDTLRLHVYKYYRKIPEADPIYKQRTKEILHNRCLFRQKMTQLKFKHVNIRDTLIKLNENLGLDISKLNRILEMAIDTEIQLDSILESQKKTLELLLHCHKFSKEVNTLVNYSSN